MYVEGIRVTLDDAFAAAPAGGLTVTHLRLSPSAQIPPRYKDPVHAPGALNLHGSRNIHACPGCPRLLYMDARPRPADAQAEPSLARRGARYLSPRTEPVLMPRSLSSDPI